ncbi:MAG: hypothetical protein WD992_03670 [Candidatus Levyibacteriota bacterium]
MKKILPILVLVVVFGIAAPVVFKADISKEPLAAPMPAPTEAPLNITTSTEVRSPNGSMTLTMKETKKSDGTILYSFLASNDKTDNLEIYSKTLTRGKMSVPANSWSPDNKHLFIVENDGISDNYLIFKATGEAFADGSTYIDFKSHYNKKMTEYALKDVTGWDAPDLLHVRTSGPSYWLELGSNAFYRLVQR